jgi:hypothetical protein
MEKTSGHLKWIVGIAFAVRTAMLLHTLRAGFVTGEGRVYADISTNLLSGRGYMLSGEMLHPDEGQGDHSGMHAAGFEFFRRVDGFYGVLRPDRPTAFLVPGYIYFMSGIFAAAGVGNFAAVRAVQLLGVGMLSVLLGISIAKRFLSGWPLVLAGLFMAIDPFEIYFEAIPASQALFSLAFLASIFLSLRALESLKPLAILAAGAAWGLAFLIRPVALAGAGVFIACLAFSRVSIRNRAGLVLAAVVATSIILVPWTLWMKAQTGQWRISPTQGGVNLWEFNGRLFSSSLVDEQEGLTALYGPLRADMDGRLSRQELAEFPDFRDESERTRDSVLVSRTWLFLAANPELLLRLPLLRFVDFFKPFSFNQASLPYLVSGFLTWGLVLLFAFGGALVMLRTRSLPALLIVGTAALYALGHIATVSGVPHRVAIDFPAAVMAAAGLGEIAGRIRAGRCRTP